MAADDPRDGHGDWRPVPDPTTLTTEQLRRELSGLREILTARLDGMDAATRLLDETVNRTPTVIQTAIAHLRELHDERFSSLRVQSDERFKSVALQFKERDERTVQLAKSSADALEAALKAAKELGVAQTEANVQANAKTEVAFAQQLKAVTDKIEVINGRLDLGDGTTAGQQEYRTDQRLGAGQLLQVAAVILTMIGLVIVALHK